VKDTQRNVVMCNAVKRRVVLVIPCLLVLLVTETLARSLADEGRRRGSSGTMTSQTADELEAEVVAVFESFDFETGKW